MQKIVNWFKNYWYYYKWPAIATAFVLVIAVFLLIQCSTQEKYDIHITYAGPDYISTQVDDIRSAVRLTFSTKKEKEAKGISVRDIVWINDELAQEYKNGDKPFNAQTNADNAKLLYTEVASGNSFIYILDRQQYEKLKQDGVFEPLADVFGEKIPECAIDEYGIDFKNTEFAKYFDCFKEWRGDLVLCLRSSTLSESLVNRLRGSKAYERSYELHRQVFMDLAQFSVK